MNEECDDPGVHMKSVIFSSLVDSVITLNSDVVEDNAHNFLVVIVNIQKSECHLDNEFLGSTNDVARNINFRGEKFAQVIIVR